MKTAEILLKKYNDKFVPLERVAVDYFGISDPRTINRMAARRAFGKLRPFRARDSSGSPWLVDIDNLAETLDERAKCA